jgi:hypothetical protein
VPEPKNPHRVPSLLSRADPVGRATTGGAGVTIRRSSAPMADERTVKTTGTYANKDGDSFFFRADTVFPEGEWTLVEAAPEERAEPAAPETKAEPRAPQTKSERPG